MNTGVQRVVRELFRALSATAPVTPLVWDPGLQTYCTLSRREHGFLVRPFAGRARRADAEPGRRANPVPLWSKLARRLTHRWNRLDLPAHAAPGDTLFVPEIFQDNRLAWLATLKRRTNLRLVAVCHDAIAWSRPDITPPARQAGFAAYLETLSACDHVVAISRETASALQSFWREHALPAPTVSIHPWPVDHSGAPRTVYPPSTKQPPAVLCVGTLEPRKNHLTLLAACRQLWQRGTRFELILIGRTTAQWGDQVLATLAELRAAHHPIRWLRHVDDATLRQAYEACAFTVFPSLIEGFGLPILESLWYGRPCVCGRDGAIGEVAAGGGCLTIDQTDPAALASALEALLTDPSLYSRLCDEARSRPFGTWANLATTLLPLLKL